VSAVPPATTGPVWPVRLNTHLWNPGGPAGRALLLHGLGSDGTTMWRLASHLADRGYLVAAPDLRSHGGSPSAADHRLGALTEDVAILGAAWDLVVGHSLGGAVAASLLARDDVEVSAALLVDPVLELADGSREPLDHNPSWDLSLLRTAWRSRVHLLAADPARGALLGSATLDHLVDGVRTTGETVAGAGHSVHRDDPAAVLAAIDALLEPAT